MKRKVLLIYTGGTIGMEMDYSTGSLVPFEFSGIFEKLPEMQLLDCEVTVQSFEKPLDSSDVGPAEWKKLAEYIGKFYHDFDGFLILHGTDTLSYTASALSFMLRGLRKPVIISGSQLPIGDLRTDAKENLLTGLYFASLYENNEAVIQEVAVYFEYKLLRGNRTLKYSSEYFAAYVSPNYPVLAESGVHINLKRESLYRPPSDEEFCVDEHLSTDVIFWRMYPGMPLSAISACPPAAVVILQVFGSGTVCNSPEMRDFLENLAQHGSKLVIISQCISGGVSLGKYENSNIFREYQAFSGKDMTAEAALTKAMHLAHNPKYAGRFEQLFEKNLCGEISENNL